MENFTKADAPHLIKAALDSGALKLAGPSGSVEHARKTADIDAAYLLRLLQRLQGLNPTDK